MRVAIGLKARTGRAALVAGARACDLELTTLPDKSALDDAAKVTGLTRARLEARLAALGRSAGPPWGKDQKEAAAAALVALAVLTVVAWVRRAPAPRRPQ